MLHVEGQQLPLFNLEPHEPPGADWHEQILSALDVPNGPAWPDRFGKALRSWLYSHGQQPIKTLSLFSGGGGLDIAFHDAGFEVLEMVEIEKQFAETLTLNSKPGRAFDGAQVRCIDIREYEPPPDLAVDFVIGGPPCQTFSAAGRRAAGVKGTTDPRGTLFEEYVRLLGILRPKGFLFENVYGITGAEGGDPWREIQKAFREAGYVINFRVLDAADYGTPQHRERLFIVGLRSDIAEQHQYLFPVPTHGPDSPNHRPFFSAGEAVVGADRLENPSLKINGRWGDLIADIPPGLNYSFYTKEMGHPMPVFAWRSKFSDFMYKADPNVPVRTVKAQGGNYTGPFSWENRHFNVSEMKRLQTFPDDYEIFGKRQVQIHQLGNSVPPQVGRILALSILDQIFGVKLPFPMHYLHDAQKLGFRTRKRSLTAEYGLKARKAIATLQSDPTFGTAMEGFPIDGVRHLMKNFDFKPDPGPESFASHLSYKISDSELLITAIPIVNGKKKASKSSYTINVTPALGSAWNIPLKKVILVGKGDSPEIFTTLWKAFEEYVKNYHKVDDLVQLSGYYQYSSQLTASLNLSSKFPSTTLWKVLGMVVAGIGVSSQLPPESLADLWEVDLEEVLPIMQHLRGLGFEVRNHRTNPQITSGEYLIPYSFPTLTPRSVQLRKKL